MKTQTIVITLMVIVSLLLISQLPCSAQQNPVPSFKGVVCWDATIANTDPDTPLEGKTFDSLVFAKHIGNGLYRIEVALVDTSPIGLLYPLFGQGTGIFVGDEIIFSISNSHDYTPSLLREAGVGGITVSTEPGSFLDGTGWGISKIYNPLSESKHGFPPGFSDIYYEFTFIHKECPKAVEVTSPNGGETLAFGGTWEITWETDITVQALVKKVILKFSKNGGATWEKIATIVGEDPGSYIWNPVPTFGTTKSNCKIKVVIKDAAGNVLGKDRSDDTFTITEVIL